MNCNYSKTSPLPFQGQKRFFVGPYKNALLELNEKQHINTVVDLFGGSGLLSHVAKRTLPECKVVYNDFDSFSDRLLNIDRTNQLLTDIRTILSDYPKEKKVSEPYKQIILKMIENESRNGYIDFITLSASILFAGNYANNIEQLRKATFYNCVKKNDYIFSPADYLQGLEITKQNYWELFSEYKTRNNVLFVVDPPYLSTDTQTYHSGKYWKLKDYLNVLNVLHNQNYIFFTSNKSSLVDLCEWFSENYKLENPFSGATCITHGNNVNYHGKYIDMMFYKSKILQT